MKAKVLLLSPYQGTVGGISKWTGYILDYYKNLNPANIELVQYYTSNKGKLVAGNSIFIRIFRGIREYLPMYKTVTHLLDEDFDAVHLCSSASISLFKDFLILRAARRKNKKTIIHFHFGRIPQIFQEKRWEYRLLLKVLRLSDTIIVMDKKSYNTLKDAGFENVESVPNPLSPLVSEAILRNKDVLRNDRVIVYAGHVLVTKGVFELVEACKSINNITLKVIGSVAEEMRMKLRSVAGDGCDSWLKIMGEQPFNKVIDEMQSSGIFVLPSYSEGFPNVIIESMACGCPIVATDVGAIPEMLDTGSNSNCGICVKPKDIEGLKNGIEKMLEDREYALQCGENARKRVDSLFSMPIIWESLTHIWVKLLEKNQ